MPDATWFRPVCDNVLKKVFRWHEDYFRGVVYADKSFLTKDGRVVDKPTIYEYKLRISLVEMRHLVRILTTLMPNHDITQKLAGVERLLLLPGKHKENKIKLIPPNNYEIGLSMYRDHVKEVYEALIQAKTGVGKISDTVKDQKDQGKAPFEF